MGIYRIEPNDRVKISALFEGWEETLIWSCLQGYMGTAWAECNNEPKSAQIVIADFCFFAGEVNESLIRNKPIEHKSKFVIMVPPNDEWARQIEKTYGDKAKKVMRYAIKKDTNSFDVEKLRAFTKLKDEQYTLSTIDEGIYNQVRKNGWSASLCDQFESYEAYKKSGIGVVVLRDGEVVSGASSYTVYREGIEIEIDTREDCRRKGLALACGAKLILECVDRGLYPSWDAQNKWSVGLAEKLGYHFDKEYVAYEIFNY